MPGIVGVLGTGTFGDSRAVVDRMLESMRHESFYRSGAHSESDLALTVGWISHQDSLAARLPSWNRDHSAFLVLHGEDYSAESGADRGGDGDGLGYLLDRYDKLGERFFESLNGCFSGVLVDLRRRRVAIFNDRFGLCRVYVHETPDALYFASEAKALLSILPELRRLDPRGMAEWLSCGCVLQNRTLFSGVTALPPGSVWSRDGGAALKKGTYFAISNWEAQEPLPVDRYYGAVKETFVRILPRYFAGSRRVAMSLTGGLDSRMIMAWAPCGPGAMPCLTHSGIYRECADVKVARHVAKICQQPHQVIEVAGDFLARFPELAVRSVYLTDGCMDTSGSVGVYVNQIARGVAPVRMTGNYGSEILRWLVAFKPCPPHSTAFDAGFGPHLRTASDTYAVERAGSVRTFIAGKQTAWHHQSRFALESTQLTVRSPFLDNELVGLAFRAPDELRINQALAARLIGDGNPSLAAFPTDLGPMGRTGPIGRIQEAYQTFTFKAEYAYDYGMPQWLVRFDQALASLHLERLFLGRHKYYHFRVWFRDQLSRFVRDYLLDSRSLGRGYLNGREVRAMVEQHAAGTGNFTLEINKILTLEMIQRELIERA